jgi:predicted N-acetyltransferase YhbS
MMSEGLARIDEAIALLGHPEYYRRFGFRPAAPLGITNQWGIEDPAWMVRGELAPGEVRYPAAFTP